MKKNMYDYLALCVLLSAACFLLLTGCGAKNESADTSGAYDYGYEAATEEAAAPGMYYDDYAYGDTPAEADMTSGTSDEKLSSGSDMIGLKIIRTGNLRIESKTFDETLQYISDTVSKFGGMITESAVSGVAGSRYADYTLRVPADRFDAFFTSVADGQTVTSRTITAEDVTESYTDLKNRLETAQKKYDRLLELIERAEDLSDLAMLEMEIAETESDIDDITGLMNGIDARVSYSTIYISVIEKTELTAVPEDPGFGARLASAFQNGASGALRVAGAILIGLARAWVVILILVVIVLAAVLIIRRTLKKKKDENKRKLEQWKKEHEPQEAEKEP